MQLIPDTNFLVYCIKYKLIDSLLDCDLIILEQVINELKKISNDKKTKQKDREAASLALEFLKINKARIRKQEGEADDAIIAWAKKYKIAIATMDKEMRIRAKKLKIKVVGIRQKKYLEK